MKDNNNVKIGKEIRAGGFKEGYYSLPHKMLVEAREEICRLCYWNVGTFRIKLSGKIAFRIYEINQIDEYFKRYNLNAWTGDQLKNV